VDIKATTDLIHEYFGNYSGVFLYTAWIYYPENVPPVAPVIAGSEGGAVGEYIDYSFVSTDENLDDLYYFIDWGDGNIDEWIGPYVSGEEAIVSHMWSEIGEYEIKAKARDISENESKWSEPFHVTISNPPEKPTLTGPTSGKPYEVYTYFATSTDPDGDQIYYLFDWGDGFNTGWLGPYNTGETVQAKHGWTKQGSYSISVKAKDVYDAESDLSDPFEILIPRDKSTSNMLYWRLFVQFPLFEKFLNSIFWR